MNSIKTNTILLLGLTLSAISGLVLCIGTMYHIPPLGIPVAVMHGIRLLGIVLLLPITAQLMELNYQNSGSSTGVSVIFPALALLRLLYIRAEYIIALAVLAALVIWLVWKYAAKYAVLANLALMAILMLVDIILVDKHAKIVMVNDIVLYTAAIFMGVLILISIKNSKRSYNSF